METTHAQKTKVKVSCERAAANAAVLLVPTIDLSCPSLLSDFSDEGKSVCSYLVLPAVVTADLAE
jgi:hypothetical protein